MAILCGGILGATVGDSLSAQRKIDAIAAGRYRPGSTVLFSPREINEWVTAEAKAYVPHGLTDLRLTLGAGVITATAQVDFLKLKQDTSTAAPGELEQWIGQNLLAGQRPVTVTVRVESRAGKARVDVERVEISGVPIEGATLDWVIRTWLPNVSVNRWFDLAPGVERLAVRPSGFAVYIGKV